MDLELNEHSAADERPEDTVEPPLDADREWLRLSVLTRARLLTADEERELSEAARAGSLEARARLIEANMRLVLKIARRFHHNEVPFEDLVQEGAIGLMTACERYDGSRGYRFSTYAIHWIRQAISRAIDTKARAIRLPSHVADGLRKIQRARAEIYRETGSEPSIEQLAERSKMSPRRIATYLNVTRDPISLDAVVGEKERTQLATLIPDTEAPDPEDSYIIAEFRREVQEILAGLSERERLVVDRRFGLADGEPRVLQDIGHECGISRERVRQIEEAALRYVRAAARRRRLADYLTP